MDNAPKTLQEWSNFAIELSMQFKEESKENESLNKIGEMLTNLNDVQFLLKLIRNINNSDIEHCECVFKPTKDD